MRKPRDPAPKRPYRSATTPNPSGETIVTLSSTGAGWPCPTSVGMNTQPPFPLRHARVAPRGRNDERVARDVERILEPDLVRPITADRASQREASGGGDGNGRHHTQHVLDRKALRRRRESRPPLQGDTRAIAIAN